MGTWSKRVILVCGVVAVGCGGKSGNEGVDAAVDIRTIEVRAEVCQPNCDGKECGDDGCGGVCICDDGVDCTVDGGGPDLLCEHLAHKIRQVAGGESDKTITAFAQEALTAALVKMGG